LDAGRQSDPVPTYVKFWLAEGDGQHRAGTALNNIERHAARAFIGIR
jgi:hypothetical protein